jgi:pimeloyl-ACP methyl ester carboxylesterase
MSRAFRSRNSLVLAFLAFVAVGAPPALAAVTVKFTLPAENVNPTVFGSVPYPSDLYFDQGEQGDGNGTLLNTGANIGLSADVVRNTNYTATIERGLDVMDGFGVTTGCFFFFTGSIATSSLPTSPRLAPTAADSVFLMNLTDGSLVPIALKANVDTRIPNVLTVLPLPGHPLDPQTQYACVVSGAAGGVTDGVSPVVPTADFVAARTHGSANTDANNIYGNAADFVVAHGGPAVADIAGMAVFTTQSTLEPLRLVRANVLPSLVAPTADLSNAQLIFDNATANNLDALYGFVPHSHLSIVATGYFGSPRFQTNDPNGNGPTEDLPNTGNLAATCTIPCEPNDEVFVYTSPTDKTPIIQNAGVTIPFTVAIPSSAQPAGGYPIIINQHGLGGDRKLVADLADVLATAGFASIGIDAVAHGYRFVDPMGTIRNFAADQQNNFGGTAIPDGFSDGLFLGLPISSISTQLGFFQGFTNIAGAADNFRQTCTDLMQLVRLIQDHTIEGALGGGLSIDANNIFYIGHSLGGIMGSCLAAFEPVVKAYALNATGGGLTSQLLLNSSIGAGALGSLNTIFTLDPANVEDQFAMFPNFGQTLLDRADPIAESVAWIGAPVVGGPRNIMQISDDSDEVVPNQANEAVGLASGLEIFDPFVKNLLLAPESMPITATAGTVSGNGPLGRTAFYLQQGTAAHAATVTPFVSSLSFVPGHAIVSEWPNAFPTYERRVRIQNAFVLPNILAWFNTIVSGSPSGTFSFSTPPTYNPIESTNVPTGVSSHTFFARTVNAGGAASYTEATSDVTVDFSANNAAGRLSADRSILGTTALATSEDLPPGISALSTGVLPFFTTMQKNPAGTFTADVTVAYTPADLAIAGIVDGSANEAGLQLARVGGPGTCLIGGAACANSAACGANGPCVELLATSVDTTNNELTAIGLTHFSIFAALNPGIYAPALSIPGTGNDTKECALEYLLSDPAGAAVLDRNGNPSFKQSCTDGDPTCDFDNVVGQCTFHAALCVNVVDTRFPNCTADKTNVIEVSKPSVSDAANPNKPGDNTNRAALLATFDADGPIVLPDSKDNDCAPVDLIVPLKTGSSGFRITTKRIKVRATTQQTGTHGPVIIKDSDVLKLTCNP